jgi:peptidoglycan/LPS O-acetylase OafA/YrhL
VVLSLIGLVSLLAPFVSTYGIYLAAYVQLAFGCAAALLLHRPSTYEVVARVGRYPAVATLGVLLVILQFLIPGTGIGQDLYAPYGAVACLLLVGLVTTTAPWIAWLWSRPMVVTATLSYALYLVHNFGLNFAEKLVPGGHGLAGSLVSTALGLTLAYLIAYGLNRTVERPFISLGQRITQRRRRAFDQAVRERSAALVRDEHVARSAAPEF